VSTPVNTNNAVPSRNSLILCLFITIVTPSSFPARTVESIKNASHSGWENHDFSWKRSTYDPRILRVDGKKYRSVLSELPARVSAHI
jgi:hypothetical protein